YLQSLLLFPTRRSSDLYTTAIAYGSTIIAGIIAFITAKLLYPVLLGSQSLGLDVSDIDEGSLTPYFEVEMPAPFEVMTALLLALDRKSTRLNSSHVSIS